MPDKTPKKPKNDPNPWGKFAARWAGYPHLSLDPLYALPEELIGKITHQIPDLMDATAEKFERNLTKTAGGGFFLQTPFDCLLMSGPTDPKSLAQLQKIQAMEIKVMRKDGRNDAQIQIYFDRKTAMQKKMTRLRLAYCGWLITEHSYLKERDALKKLGAGFVVESGGFPRLPNLMLKQKLTPKDQTRLLEEGPTLNQRFELMFRLFYRRWNLDHLITWDLPCPMEPELEGVREHDPSDTHEAGVVVFVPTYLLRDKSITLADLVSQHKISHRSDHLSGWMDRDHSAKDPLGYDRRAELMKLYRFWKLALASRYALKGRTEQLDLAFAMYMDTKHQNIKKVRLAGNWG